MSEEESGFNVVDKRKVKESEEREEREEGEEVAADGAPRSSDSSDASHSSDSQESTGPGKLPHLSVMDRMLMCIDILHQGAWVALGLVADPATGQVEKDLESARAAIDGVAFLVEKIEPSLDENTRREVKRVVSDLQINFVRQSQK